MRRYILTALMIILLVGVTILSVGVTDAQLVLQQNKDTDLKLPCSYNGSFCTTNAVCNITITYPNESLLVDNALMTNTGNGKPNITLSGLNIIGVYQAHYGCCENGYCDSDAFEFEVTPNGNKVGTAESIIYLIFMASLVGVFILLLYGAIKLPFGNTWSSSGELISVNDLKYLKVMCMVFAYLTLMSIFGIARQITANYLFLNDVYRIFQWMYWFMFSFVWPIIVVSIVLMLVMFLTGKKLKSAIDRGFTIHKGEGIR